MKSAQIISDEMYPALYVFVMNDGLIAYVDIRGGLMIGPNPLAGSKAEWRTLLEKLPVSSDEGPYEDFVVKQMGAYKVSGRQLCLYWVTNNRACVYRVHKQLRNINGTLDGHWTREFTKEVEYQNMDFDFPEWMRPEEATVAKYHEPFMTFNLQTGTYAEYISRAPRFTYEGNYACVFAGGEQVAGIQLEGYFYDHVTFDALAPNGMVLIQINDLLSVYSPEGHPLRSFKEGYQVTDVAFRGNWVIITGKHGEGGFLAEWNLVTGQKKFHGICLTYPTSRMIYDRKTGQCILIPKRPWVVPFLTNARAPISTIVQL